MGGKRLIPAWVAAVALVASGQALGCPVGVAGAGVSKSDLAVHPGLKPAKPAQGNTGDEPGNVNPNNPDVNGLATRPGAARAGSYGAPSSAIEGVSREPNHARVVDKAALGMRMPAGRDHGSPSQDSGPAPEMPNASLSVDVGLKVRPLSDVERHDFGVPEGGLVVTGVNGESVQHAGFRMGDVLLTLDGVAVTSPAQFHQLILQLPHDRPVPVLVRRPASNLFLPLDAPHR